MSTAKDALGWIDEMSLAEEWSDWFEEKIRRALKILVAIEDGKAKLVPIKLTEDMICNAELNYDLSREAIPMEDALKHAIAAAPSLDEIIKDGMMVPGYHTGLKSFLRQYAPDFCWCSVYDLLIMVEQEPLYENVTYDSLTATVYQLKKEGLFITKKTIHRRDNQSRGFLGELYLRVR